MNGYQITLFTELDRLHEGKQMADWIVELAHELELPGATVLEAAEGYGRNGQIHSIHSFELSTQTLEIQMTVTAEDADRLFEKFKLEKVQLFYTKFPVEFGRLGESNS